MIKFNYETNFILKEEKSFSNWISSTINEEAYTEGDINYIFCSDDYLHQINLDFLKHDTYTDIISFDYSLGKTLHGDIYISIDRVRDNAQIFQEPFQKEISRVIIHGVLHFCGYKDKTETDKQAMRAKEDYYISLL